MNKITQPIRSIFSHSHLLKEFISREIKGRFAGSIVGTFWTLINPITNIAVYLFLFSIVLRISVTIEETGTDKFAIFFLVGFFPWIMFSESLVRSVGIIVENDNLITKVVFPVELLPCCSVISSFIINGAGFIAVLLYLAFIGYADISWLFLILVIPLQLIFAFGLAFMLSAMCVFIRDIRELLGIILMIWFYATPIIYPFSMVPASIKNIMLYNPMHTFLILFRETILMHKLNWILLLQLVCFSTITYMAGAWFFMRAKSAFGDVL